MYENLRKEQFSMFYRQNCWKERWKYSVFLSKNHCFEIKQVDMNLTLPERIFNPGHFENVRACLEDARNALFSEESPHLNNLFVVPRMTF